MPQSRINTYNVQSPHALERALSTARPRRVTGLSPYHHHSFVPVPALFLFHAPDTVGRFMYASSEVTYTHGTFPATASALYRVDHAPVNPLSFHGLHHTVEVH